MFSFRNRKSRNTPLTDREIELLRKAAEEEKEEFRGEILENKADVRGFKRFLFPNLTPGGPLGLVNRRLIENRKNWPEENQKEI